MTAPAISADAPRTATTDCNYSIKSNHPNYIVQKILFFGLIFQQPSIITRVNIGKGTPIVALMFVRKKQIRQETELHGECENSQPVISYMSTLIS